MAITTKQQRQQRPSEALQLIADVVPSHWDDEQLEAVVSMFREHGLL